MIRIDKDTRRQVAAVREKCVQLDKEHGLKLAKAFDEALDYADRFGDQELEGKSVNILRPLDRRWEEGEELTPEHFSFGFSATRGGEEWFFVAMFYHNGGAPKLGDPVEIAPSKGPHWSFHS